MGVVNVTPDSFSDGGEWFERDEAVAHGLKLAAQGAAVIDVGGESTRHGADLVDEAEEMRRVVPVIEALAPSVRVSVDTRRASVARAAVAAGATLINDVSASLGELAAELGVGWVAMHMQGSPKTMQDDPRYEDVVSEVCEFLADRAAGASRAGVQEVWVDPGFGFGKTMEHNLLLLEGLERIASLGYPVLVGLSRKTTLGRLLARSDGIAGSVPVDDRLEGSIATQVWAMCHGAQMIRAHDVVAAVQAAEVVAR